MDKKSKTFGLNLDKLARILGICSDAARNENEMTQEQQKAELLQDLLGETLPLGSSEDGRLREELAYLCDISGLSAGESIRNMLNTPEIDIALLRKVKDHGKKLARCPNSEAEHEAADTIYYAAIASALVFHNLRITSFSYKDLEHSFSILSKESWISPDLITLFTKALQRCHSKTDNRT